MKSNNDIEVLSLYFHDMKSQLKKMYHHEADNPGHIILVTMERRGEKLPTISNACITCLAGDRAPELKEELDAADRSDLNRKRAVSVRWKESWDEDRRVQGEDERPS